MNWIRTKDTLPEKNGEYLCVCNGIRGEIVTIRGYRNNLHEVDEYDFSEEKAGFFTYDSGRGFLDRTNQVLYWMPLPEAPEGDYNEN